MAQHGRRSAAALTLVTGPIESIPRQPAPNDLTKDETEVWNGIVAQSMDRRAHPRLDQPQPPPGARLRALCQDRRRVLHPRDDSPHAQASGRKPFIMSRNF